MKRRSFFKTAISSLAVVTVGKYLLPFKEVLPLPPPPKPFILPCSIATNYEGKIIAVCIVDEYHIHDTSDEIIKWHLDNLSPGSKLIFSTTAGHD